MYEMLCEFITNYKFTYLYWLNIVRIIADIKATQCVEVFSNLYLTWFV